MRLAAWVALLTAALWGQTGSSSNGTLSGTLVDGSGAPTAGVRVTLYNASSHGRGKGKVAEQTTDAEGKFTFQDLRPGSYDAVTSKRAYLRSQIRAIEVVADKISKLRIGMISEKEARAWRT